MPTNYSPCTLGLVEDTTHYPSIHARILPALNFYKCEIAKIMHGVQYLNESCYSEVILCIFQIYSKVTAFSIMYYMCVYCDVRWKTVFCHSS